MSRSPGGRRFTFSDYAALRELASRAADLTLPRQAIEAMTDPDGIETFVDVSFELESNRMGRGVTNRLVPGNALPEWVNVLRNPRFGIDATDWVVSGASITLSRVTNAEAPGTWGLVTAGATGALPVLTPNGMIGGAWLGNANPGDYASARIKVKNVSARSLQLTLTVEEGTAAGAVLGNATGGSQVIQLGAGSTTDIAIQDARIQRATAGRWRIGFSIREASGAAIAATGDLVRVSSTAAYLHGPYPGGWPKGVPPIYGDGDVPGWVWDGDPHDSSSRPGIPALLDPTMSVADLSTGRRNAARNYAIADASFADTAYVWDTGLGEEDHPVAPDRTVSSVIREIVNPRATDPAPIGAPAPFQGGTYGTDPGTPATVSQVGAAGRLATAEAGPVWVLDRGATTFATAPAFDHITDVPSVDAIPLERKPRRRIGPSGSRTFTVVGRFLSNAPAFTLRAGIVVTFENNLTQRFMAPTSTSVESGTELQRIAGRVTATAVPGSEIVDVRPLFLFDDPSTATRLEFRDVQVYSGEVRSDEAGLEVGILTPPLAVEQRFDEIRRLNRVEVAGLHTVSQVTAISVEALLPDGLGWTTIGTGEGIRAAADFPEIDTAGIRVWIEEVQTSDGVPFLTEVDPMLTTQLSGSEIESLEVEWSRETEPGTGSSPVGNYEASSLTLNLDNTDGRWLPQRNASLDLGHRVTVGLGIRWANQLQNPRGEENADGWSLSGGGSIYRAMGGELGDDAPLDTAIAVTVNAGLTRSGYSDLIPAVDGDMGRLSGWYRLTGGGPTAQLRASIVTFANTTDRTSATVVQRVSSAWIKPVDGWVFVPPLELVVADTVAVRVELTVQAGAGAAATAYATRQRVEWEDGFGGILETETIVPGGVFYTEPYDTDSESSTVEIQAVDRLGRFKDSAVSEAVRIDQSIQEIVTELALTFLDYDADQVLVDPSIAGYVIPYAYPSGPVGTYFADLAKAVVGTLHVDQLDRLVLAQRQDVTGDTAAEIRADNALIRYRRPPAYDSTTSIVAVTAAPLVPGAVEELWAMPPGGIVIPASGSYQIVAPYSTTPAVDGAEYDLVADGPVDLVSAVFYSDRAELTYSNPSSSTARVIADLRVTGSPLVESPLSARLAHDPSVRRYGPRELPVEAKLIQTQAQLQAVTEVLLDAFRAVDDNGVRRLPDLTFDALGLLHVTAGDRVALSDPRTSLGADYAILARKLTYANGSILSNEVRVRQTDALAFAIVDQALADDAQFAGY